MIININNRATKNLFTLLAVLLLSGNMAVLKAQPTMEWAASMGGTASDLGSAVAVDDSGNVYTAGSFSGKADFNPGTGAADTFYLTAAGGGDIFVSKLDAQGKFLWAKKMGGTMAFGSDWAKCLALDGMGNIYLSGIFYGKADFDPSPDPADTFYLSAGTTGYAYAQDAFVAKLDKDGNFVWAKQFVGYGSIYASDNESSNQGRAITVSKATGDVYVTGSFIGKVDFNPSTKPADTFFLRAVDTVNGQNMYITKLDSVGNFVWAKGFAGQSSIMGRGITLDLSGNVLTTGYYYNKVDFNPGEAPADTFFLQSTNNSMDIFVSKLDSSGNFIWAKSMGAPNGSGDLGNGIATDNAGSVYTTGYFSGTDADFDPGSGTHLFTALKYLDIFISKLDSSGNFVWARQMGSAGAGIEESGYGIVISRSGDVLVTGAFTDTTDFNIGGTPRTVIAKGNRDVFIISLSNDGNNIKWLRTFGGTKADVAWAITIDGSGNIFTAGSYLDTVDFDPPNRTVLTAAGTQTDIFVLKLNCADTSSYAFSLTTCEDSYTLNGEIYSESGVYTQRLPNASGCDSTITLELTISKVAHPVITVKEFLLGTVESYSTYQWFLNGNIIEGATDSTYVVTENGNYTVAVTNADGCTDTSDIYTVKNVPSAIADIGDVASEIDVYPNPASDFIHVKAPVLVKVIISGIDGRVIREVENAQRISIKDLPGGVYILRITDTDGTLYKTMKVVKGNS